VTNLAPLAQLAAEIVAAATARDLKIVTAESCTGGLIAGVLTEIAGSSAVVDRGFVTYSNDAKSEMLGVPAELIVRLGAVSREVAIAMVEGAIAHSGADLAVSVTGIAGPGGGSEDKPVGLVYFGGLRRGNKPVHAEHRFGEIGRSEVRLASVREALLLLKTLI
jgi:nicotinamide-nucleotide amidase